MKLLVLFAAICLAMPVMAAPKKGDVVTMKGSYNWKREGKKRHDDLVGTFTCVGSKKWDAVFKFKWGRSPHTYTGTVKGDVTSGRITGNILNDAKNRSFTFKASVRNGKLKGKHKETTKGRAGDTGDFEMEIVKDGE